MDKGGRESDTVPTVVPGAHITTSNISTHRRRRHPTDCASTRRSIKAQQKLHDLPTFIANQRAKEAKRRAKQSHKSLADHANRHIAALQLIADPMHDPDFQSLLQRINEDFSAATDYTDNSPTIRHLLANNELFQITDSMYIEDEHTLKVGGIEELYKQRISALKFLGMERHLLRRWLTELVPHRVEATMDLLENGCSVHMLPSWQPNGFVSVRNGKESELYTAIAEHAAAKLRREGRNVILRMDQVHASVLQRLNGVPTVMSQIDNKIPRVCHHLSKGNKTHPSYNDSVDSPAHLSKYPRERLITLHKLADMCHAMKTKHPNCKYLHAAIVDIRGAYQQFLVSYEKFLLIWNKFNILRDGVAVSMLQGGLVGTFGDGHAGDIWNVIGSLLDELHNLESAHNLWVSKIYVDDTTIIAPPYVSTSTPSEPPFMFTEAGGSVLDPIPGAPQFEPNVRYIIHDAVCNHRDNAARLLGPNATEDKKTLLSSGYVVSIGRHLNLQYDQ